MKRLKVAITDRQNVDEIVSLADKIEKLGPALKTGELASLLGVSTATIFRLARAGRIPCFHVGTCVRFDSKEVAEWLRRM